MKELDVIIGNSGIAEYGYEKVLKLSMANAWRMEKRLWRKRTFSTYIRTKITKDGITWAILGYPLSETIQFSTYLQNRKSKKLICNTIFQN